MEQLLSLLTPYLNSLGPWGVLIGVGATVLFNRVRARNSDPQRPVLDALLALLKQPDPPKPTPTPVVPEEHKRPLIDALMKALAGK